MPKAKRHIVIILLGIFFFPMTFQCLHIVWHQTHNFQNHFAFHYHGTTGKTGQHNATCLSQQIKHCPICEFQLTIDYTTAHFVYKTNIPVVIKHFSENTTEEDYQKVLLTKTPRAPPVS